ncbi:MAG: helix-turn-helix domain-containing protein [Desulfobacteraceae bacterium]|nr:helix-turn-helix domain-containing protein [Desulfobacteraceae bacterium]
MINRKTTPEELALVLEEGEGYTLEFKQNINADLSRELVAFANASGGRIFIGVDDNNRIVGCDFSNELFSRIETMAASCDPPVAIFIEKLLDQKILVIHVPEGANRPHRCTKGFYLRNGANSQKMSTADITAFIQSEGRVRFDQQLRLDLDWETILDHSRLEHFLSLSKITQRSDTKNLLLNLGAGDLKNNRFYLNQTGMLFFAKDPAFRQPFVNVVCALFKGTAKAYILDRKELSGNILENVEEALLFLKKHLQLRWEITKDSARRKEILELPEVALREAVINAVCHRDYFEQGAQVMVEIFDDRVEIHNPGGLPKGLPEKDFGKRSVCRNPNIAALLLRCDYIEKMGTGIERIYEALKKENCPPVKIEYTTLFSLVFSRPSYITPWETRKPMEKTREMSREKTREKILALLSRTPDMTTAQLAEQTGLTPKGIEWQMAQLKKKGLIERIGPARGGLWKVKKN